MIWRLLIEITYDININYLVSLQTKLFDASGKTLSSFHR